jgi:hypothetical protein
LPLPLDVKNQARVHLWYEAQIRVQDRSLPLAGSGDLDLANDGDRGRSCPQCRWPRVVAPFGLNDLFAMIARPNRTQITREIYETKVGRWCSAWPEVRIEPW